MKDLTGQKFGHLLALSPFKNSNYSKQEYWWHCKCDCGTFVDVRAACLIRGDTRSCGCIHISSGEEQIKDILKSNNIKYLYDCTFFKDLKLPSGGIGRYDFILLDDNYHPYRLIEYDGEQHYKPKEWFGGIEGLNKLQLNDKTKNEYAKQHNLPLVRIPYTVKEITLDMILGDEYLFIY